MPIRELQAPTDEPELRASPSATLSLLLSLMLVLLTFFIALIAGAHPRTNAEPPPFAGAVAEAALIAEPLAIVGDAARKDAEQRIAVLSSALAALAPESVPAGTEEPLSTRVAMPIAALFDPRSAAVRDDRREVLDRIATTAGDLPDGLRLVLAATLTRGAAGEAASVATIDDTLAAERAAALAETLVARGLPGGTILVGIVPGRSGELALRIGAQPSAGGSGTPDAASAPQRLPEVRP